MGEKEACALAGKMGSLRCGDGKEREKGKAVAPLEERRSFASMDSGWSCEKLKIRDGQSQR